MRALVGRPLATLAVLLFVPAYAWGDVNLPIVCSSCTAGEPAGSPAAWAWKTPAAFDLVLVANGPGNWGTGIWQRWDQATTFVRACPQNIPQNSNVCAGDDFLPRSTWPPLPPPVQYVPQFNSFEASPRIVAPGGEVLVSWTTQDMAGCSASWRTTPPPNSGSDRVSITAETVLQISCTGLGGTSHIVAHRIKVAALAPEKPIQCVPYTMPESSELYSSILPAGQIVYGYGCDMLDGYQWVGRSLDPSQTDQLPCLNPSWLAAITLINARAGDDACAKRLMTTQEQAVSNALEKKWKARFAVQGGGAVVRRPVYLQNPDGTRGAQFRVGGVLQYILAGLPCNGRARLTATTTRYHLVTGQTSQQGQALPADTFAQCVKQQPPSGGFP